MFLVSPNTTGYEDGFLIRADKNPNSSGARALGFNAADHVIEKLLDEAETGKLKGLYIFGQDIVSLYGEDAKKLIKKLEFVVFQGSHRNETAPLCSVVFPAAVFAEQEGTFTNCDGYVQRFFAAFPPLPDAKGGIEILSGLARELGIKLPGENAKDIFYQLSQNSLAFKGMSYENLRRIILEKATIC